MTFGRVFSLFALSRHFLKIGGASTKIKLKFVFVFGLHYLCRIIQQN